MNLDLIIVLAYLILMMGVGLYYRRSANTGLDDFFLAGRNIPGWLNGISYTAAMVVTGGFVCWWYLSRFGIALFVGGVLFAIFWRRLRLFTSLEFYELRFTGSAASLMRLWVAFRTSCIAMPAWTGATLLAACKIMEPTMGLTREQTLWLVVPISFAYIFLSGYRGVVVSNLIQMVIFFVGTLCLALLTLAYFGGPTGLANSIVTRFGTESLRSFPPLHHEVFPLAAAIAWMLGQTIGYGGDAAPMSGAMEGQRILSTRTPREAVTMYLTTAVTLFTLVFLVSLPCIAAPLLWPHLRDANAADAAGRSDGVGGGGDAGWGHVHGRRQPELRRSGDAQRSLSSLDRAFRLGATLPDCRQTLYAGHSGSIAGGRL
jgi:SSS family solute:Na+ symporter